MAKLYAGIETNRQAKRGIEGPHRLGDTWVSAEVKNWNHRLSMLLDEDGNVSIEIVNLKARGVDRRWRSVFTGKLEDLLHDPTDVARADAARAQRNILVTTE